ncbi:MAG: hypothetical protein PHU62_00240 [Bacteroidales bacterium]|jgi:uridine kinase|nr:hypothetical protein [Bacteroidales bacterium]MDD2203901.1 hypothetical protein [Bacteroidales bacterium]MDD3152827.1 hypothetical protein [Bacteroidales bacterium]MDD3913084.1 hypothetical protein [Bacteroidales bacterium]MDD4632999.1 hypothetical protein [Bacteroidales bacterium]
MLSDVLLIEEKHEKAAKAIFDIIEKRRKDNSRFVVAISGESGSGKTELSHCIAKEYKKIGLKGKPLHTDNYYLTLPEERNAWREAHGPSFVGDTEYDWATLNANINSFRRGVTAYMPCVDIVTDQVDHLVSDFSRVNVLILDGLYALKAEDVDLRVFIDITYFETKKAQLKRGKEAQTPLRAMVLQREHEVVSGMKPTADVIIDKDYNVLEL